MRIWQVVANLPQDDGSIRERRTLVSGADFFEVASGEIIEWSTIPGEIIAIYEVGHVAAKHEGKCEKAFNESLLRQIEFHRNDFEEDN